MSHTEKPSTTDTAMDNVVPLRQSFAVPTPAAKTDDEAVRAAQKAQIDEIRRTQGDGPPIFGMCG